MPEVPLEPTSCRKLSIFDGMIVVAMSAFASFGVLQTLDSSESRAVALLRGTVWPALSSSLALLGVGLRRQRIRTNRLWRRPGWLACVAVAVASAYGSLLTLPTFCYLANRRTPSWAAARISVTELEYLLPHRASLAVTVAWAILLLSRQWHPGRGWVELLDRILGWYWLAFPVAGWLVGMLRDIVAPDFSRPAEK
jgi:hypothetical protein